MRRDMCSCDVGLLSGWVAVLVIDSGFKARGSRSKGSW